MREPSGDQAGSASEESPALEPTFEAAINCGEPPPTATVYRPDVAGTAFASYRSKTTVVPSRENEPLSQPAASPWVSRTSEPSAFMTSRSHPVAHDMRSK